MSSADKASVNDLPVNNLKKTISELFQSDSYSQEQLGRISNAIAVFMGTKSSIPSEVDSAQPNRAADRADQSYESSRCSSSFKVAAAQQNRAHHMDQSNESSIQSEVDSAQPNRAHRVDQSDESSRSLSSFKVAAAPSNRAHHMDLSDECSISSLLASAHVSRAHRVDQSNESSPSSSSIKLAAAPQNRAHHMHQSEESSMSSLLASAPLNRASHMDVSDKCSPSSSSFKLAAAQPNRARHMDLSDESSVSSFELASAHLNRSQRFDQSDESSLSSLLASAQLNRESHVDMSDESSIPSKMDSAQPNHMDQSNESLTDTPASVSEPFFALSELILSIFLQHNLSQGSSVNPTIFLSQIIGHFLASNEARNPEVPAMAIAKLFVTVIRRALNGCEDRQCGLSDCRRYSFCSSFASHDIIASAHSDYFCLLEQSREPTTDLCKDCHLPILLVNFNDKLHSKQGISRFTENYVGNLPPMVHF